jgi:hypothetical protein
MGSYAAAALDTEEESSVIHRIAGGAVSLAGSLRATSCPFRGLGAAILFREQSGAIAEA